MSDDLLDTSILKHAQPTRLGVAVSGGGDSMALLDLIIAYARDTDLPFEVITVDHGLRTAAFEEAKFVAIYCAKHGVPHETKRWHRATADGNLQAEARNARYALISEWAKSRKIDCVALGHTEDDLAETMLMRLARKSGVDGLSAMERMFMRDGIRWVRPLLSVSRHILRDHLKDRDMAWIEDPSNENRDFERIKARDALSALAPLGIDASTLATVGHQMAMSRNALNYYARQEAERLLDEESGDVILTRHVIPAIPIDIERRLLIASLQWIGGAEYAPRQRALIDLQTALALGQERHTLSGCLLTHSNSETTDSQKLRITREFNAVKDLRCSTDELWDGRWRLEGQHSADFEIRALGEAVTDTPWRETGMPRTSLVASPAVWRDETLISAPVAGLKNGWSAIATGRGTLAQFLLSR